MRIVIFCFLVIYSCFLYGQEPFYWQLTDKDGLPSMTVYNIQQDQDGFIWMGTAAGVCRYDGKEFEYYRHPDQADDEIIYLEIDLFKRVWYANLSGQVFYIEDNETKKLPELYDRSKFTFDKFKLFEDRIVLLLEDVNQTTIEDEQIIIITCKEKISFDKLSKYDIPLGFGDALLNNKELIYTEVEENIFKFCFINKNSLEKEKQQFNIKLPITDHSLLSTDSASVTFYNKAQLFYGRFKDKENTISKFDFPAEMNYVQILNTEIWAMKKKGGIFIFDLKQFKPKKTFFKEKIINRLFVDIEKNHWFSTQNAGVIVIPSFNMNLITSSNNNLVTSHVSQTISNGFDNQTIIGTKKGELIFLKKEKVIKSKLLPKSTAIYSIEKNKKNKSFLIGTNETVSQFNPNNNSVKFRNNSPKTLSIKTIKLDNKDRLWIGDYSSCRLMTNSEILNVRHKENIILKKRTYAIHPDFENNVWIGTTKGLYQYTDSISTPFLINGIHEKYYFTSITQSPFDSSIWAGTHGDGILQIKNNQIINHFKEGNQLASNICNDLFADNHNNLWIATSKGLQKLNLKTHDFQLINKYDGLPNNEILNVSVNDSIVYVGTNDGIMTFAMDIETKNNIAPPIHITNFSIADKDTTIQDLYELDYDQNALQIDFVGLAYKCRGDVRYKYRMVGIDTSWVITDTRFARFPGISKGDYEFQVMALNEDNVESIEPAIIKIYIAPPYWETWWFRSLIFLALVGLIGGFFNFRYRTIRKREKLEFDYNELRAQALQAQMNPHFIFNSMNAIQHFLTLQDKENAMIYLAKFAKLIRFIFDQSKNKTTSLQKELEFLKLYVSLEKLRFQDKISVNFVVGENATQLQEEIHLPPLLIQPIIENAFKHGLFHKEEKGNLYINFKYEEPMLICIVEDNGVGRKKSTELNEWRKKNHISSGIKSTKERIELLNIQDKSFVENSFKITDLTSKSGEAIGTKVEINLKNQFKW